MRKRTLSKLIADEKGQALMLVLILMLLSGLIIAPLLAYMGTGLKVGREVFEERMYGQYAADSGVEDALYKIKVDDPSLPPEWEGIWDRDTYDTPFTYSTSDVNGNDVEVTIQPYWLLTGLEDPPEGMTPHVDLVIVGNTTGTDPVTGNGVYQISINYDRSKGELKIDRIGVWLPAGFEYVEGSSNLEADPDADYYCVPVTEEFRGGTVIMWNFSSPYPDFELLPGGSEGKAVVTFQFTPRGNPVSAFSWVKTRRTDIYLSWDADVQVYRITSEATSTVFPDKTVTVEAYAAKNEMREMGAAISGDYRAIGNSLMIQSRPYPATDYRDILLSESSAGVDDIPLDATVVEAYLYWSGWFEEAEETVIPPFPDTCSNFNNWAPGSSWELYPLPPQLPTQFRGKGTGNAAARTLTMNIPVTGSLDLSDYTDQMVKVSWTQSISYNLESSDAFYFAFSGDGGGTWTDPPVEVFHDDWPVPPSSFSYTIPAQYLTDSFKMKFFLDFNGSTECVYIDNIKISAISMPADTTCTFEINGNSEEITADPDLNPGDRVQAMLNESGPDYSYSCRKDVTELVRQYSVKGAAENPTGNGEYTVGGVDATYDANDEWAYAGWSLVIIYSSPETKGRQLYLYDDFRYSYMNCNVDFDGDGEPGGTIGGFLVPEPIEGEGDEDDAAKITCFVGEGDSWYEGDFIALNAPDNDPPTSIPNAYKLWDGTTGGLNNVWNSRSVAMSAEGVDVDTFHVTWGSDLLEPGDTSAQIDMYTQTDSWNLVYIILSFRSDIKTSGAMSYIYVGGG